MKYFRHPASEVQSKTIGVDTKIWQYSVVLKGAKIGKNCNINCHCFVENDVVLGDNVTIKSGVYLWDGVSIEDNVFVGPNVTFTNDARPRSKKYPKNFDRTTLKKGCSIGAAATIIGGITIGEYAMIGAGSVLTKNVPNNALWYGNPARPKGHVCCCGKKLEKTLRCPTCKSRYRLTANKLILSR